MWSEYQKTGCVLMIIVALIILSIVLKVTGVTASWHWGFVLAPLWVPVVIVAFLIGLTLFIVGS